MSRRCPSSVTSLMDVFEFDSESDFNSGGLVSIYLNHKINTERHYIHWCCMYGVKVRSLSRQLLSAYVPVYPPFLRLRISNFFPKVTPQSKQTGAQPHDTLAPQEPLPELAEDPCLQCCPYSVTLIFLLVRRPRSGPVSYL